MSAQVIEQRGRVGTVRAKPFLLALRRRAEVVEHFIAEIGERLEIARARDGKSLHAHAVLGREYQADTRSPT